MWIGATVEHRAFWKLCMLITSHQHNIVPFVLKWKTYLQPFDFSFSHYASRHISRPLPSSLTFSSFNFTFSASPPKPYVRSFSAPFLFHTAKLFLTSSTSRPISFVRSFFLIEAILLLQKFRLEDFSKSRTSAYLLMPSLLSF